MKKVLILLLAISLALLPVLSFAADDVIHIGVIQYVQHVALDAARDGFIQALADNGYVDGENIQLDIQNAQADASNLSTISDRFVGNNVDLVLAIATPAAQTIAGKTTDIPILGTAITDYEVARLVDSNEVPGGNVSGTTDMNPVADQIALLKELFPDAQTVGTLYTSNEDNSILQAQMAKDAIEALGMKYIEATVTNSNDVQQATQSLVGNCDALYIPTDNVFASTMPVVSAITVEAKLPVFCAEDGMVRSGGLVTLGLSYYKLGYQTGLMALRLFEGEDISTMPIEGANTFDYSFNQTIADEIGYVIPEAYAEYAFAME